MIIGINGYIGSGKDTVGNIIQYLTSDYANMNDGPTFDDMIELSSAKNLALGSCKDGSSWQIKKFAGKLKQIASLLTGISIEKFEDQEFKKEILGEEWAIYKKWKKGRLGDYRKMLEIDKNEYLELLSDTNWVVSRQAMTVREFLQKLGTDAVRFGLHSNTWVNALFVDYVVKEDYDRAILAREPKLILPNWIITDTRFPNEAQAIKDRGGIIIRVVRDINITGSFSIGKNGFKCISGHDSEIALDDWDFDYIIKNEGSIEDLINKVQEMLNKINL